MKLADLTRPEFLALDKDRVVPIIPLGSLEQHGPHLPLGTDAMQCEAIVACAEQLEPSVILAAPVLWVGNSVNHVGLQATVTLEPSNYVSILVDIGSSFIDQGFRHLLYLNGHGANSSPLLTALHELEYKHFADSRKLRIAGANWWALGDDILASIRDSPSGAAGHACEIETSLMLAIDPNAVRQDLVVDGIQEHPHPAWAGYDFDSRNRIMMVEMFHEATDSGIIGLPKLASEQKGHALLDGLSLRLAEFSREFSRW